MACKLAVFGGAGTVGEVLLPELVRRGHQVRAMQHRTPVETAGVEPVPGSLTDADAVRRTIEGADIVLQLTKGGEGTAQVIDTSVAGTLHILDAVVAAGTVRQLILASSDAATGIWYHPQAKPISHLTPPRSYAGYYSLGKVLEETMVREYSRNHGVRFTIARLSMVVQEDALLRYFLREEGTPAAHVHVACDAAGQPLRRTFVQREDVVAGLAAMVDEPRAARQVFHLSGPPCSLDRPAQYLAERLGLPVRRRVTPGAHSFSIDYRHTTRCLGWAPQYDVRRMLDAALEWREQHSA